MCRWVGMQQDHLHPHRYYTGRGDAPPHTLATWRAAQDAIAYADDCRRAARLLTAGEALALAGPSSREMETLYSIAVKYSPSEEVDRDAVLFDLGERFPEFA